MTTQNENSKSLLQEQRQAFIDSFPFRIEEVYKAHQKLKVLWVTDEARQLTVTLHKLAGNCFALGYTRLGMSVQGIENQLKEIVASSIATATAPGLIQLHSIDDRLIALFESNKNERGEKPARASLSAAQATVPNAPSLQDSRAERLVYLIENDPLQAKEIAQQIGYFGYVVEIFHDAAQTREGLNRRIPAAILMDVNFPDGDSTSTTLIHSIKEIIPDEVHIIILSEAADIATRLKATRAGGKAFFVKPVDIGALIDVLDHLMVVDDVMPYRILIVDDDQVQANVNAFYLKQAGMETFIVTDPLTIIHALNDSHPDLILLDMYMPVCSGMELAVIIRQIESFVSIPIVYLSSETDREKQLEAVGLGGDDFLTKPIKPEHLITAVSSRVDRYRQLRYLMMRDSLTGLYNHTTLKERYAQEFSRAARLNKPLTYAMIDLDKFKSVNDTFGHAAGDRVLKSLASMLSKRLRGTDVIGRYGGEEFAIVLPNTTCQNAVKIIDELRAGFAHIHHQAADRTFSVTFSCGIASFPTCGTPAELAEAADKALYQAKSSGRNRIAIHGE